MPVTAVIKMPMDGALGETGGEDTLHYAGYSIEQFSAALSTASGGATRVVDWRWSCSCGWSDQGRHVQHRPDTVATHTVTLTVLGDDGSTDTETKDVVAVDLPSMPLVMDTYHKGAGLDSDTGVDDTHAYSSWERSGYRWREGDITHSRGTPGRVRTKAGDGIDWTNNNDDVTVPRHYDDFDFGPLLFDAYGSGARPNVHFGAGKRIEFLADHHVPDEWGWSVYFKGLRCFKDVQEDDGVGSNIPGSQYDDCVFENFGLTLQGNFKRALVGGRVTGSATTGVHVACNWVALDGVLIDGNGLDGVDAEHQVYGTDINHGCFRRLVVVGSAEANDCLRSVSSRYVYVADCDVSNTRNAGAAYYPGSNGTTFDPSEHWLGERLIARAGGESSCAIDFNHNDDSLARLFKFFGARTGIVVRGYDATHKANDTRLYAGVSYAPGSGVRNFTIDDNATLTKIRNVIFFRDDNEPFFAVDDPADVDMDYCCFWRDGGVDDADDANFCVVAGVTRSLSWWRANSSNDDHSFFRDPKFTDGAAGDFTLLGSSPCIGAGQTLGEVPRDFDDAVISGAATIGPYHYDEADTTPPTVSVTAPAEASTVRGTIAVTATAADDVGVVGVQFKLDGADLGSEDTSAPYSVSWDTTTASNGAHTLRAVARDAAGNTTISAIVDVTVDNSPPTVAITSPTDGSSVAGTVSVQAFASDNVGVVGVQFKLDGVNLGAEDTSAPYSVPWDTTGATNGAHVLTAVARDGAGNTTTSVVVNVTVDNVAPTVAVTSPSEGAALHGTVAVVASVADNIGVVGVQFKLDGVNLGSEDTSAPFSISWDTTGATNGAHSLTAVARDAAGNTTTSAVVNVTVDNTAPVVAITSPTDGAALRGTVAVEASASDAFGIVGVQFKLDGVNLGAEDTSAPYSVSWDTTGATNGAHALTAVARDAAGNTTTAATVNVTVDNSAPSVAITSPTEDEALSGLIAVTATAADNVGVVGVQLKLDGVNLGGELVSAPYTLAWDTTGSPDGAHTLTAVARDAVGNVTTSAAVHVTTDNSAPTVAITSPSEGATVSGTISLDASASDNVGIGGVQFKVDGVNVGAEDTAAPYSFSWDTSSVANGSHTLTAVARDAAGNTTTSAEVHVTVANGDLVPPTVAITSPTEGATVSGTVTLEASAADNVGVLAVTFKLDGIDLGVGA